MRTNIQRFYDVYEPILTRLVRENPADYRWPASERRRREPFTRVGLFLFDYACSNRIVWGAEGYQEIRIRHTASAPERWIEEVAPAIQAYANSSTAGVTEALCAAQAKKIDDVNAFLKSRFTASQASAIQAAHMADEQRPIESLWDAATGITAYARGVSYQDERVKLEREAGKVLKLAA